MAGKDGKQSGAGAANGSRRTGASRAVTPGLPANTPQILSALKTPLAFFGLALLVVEAPFPILFGFTKHTDFQLELTYALMCGLVVGVVLIVFALVWWRPKSLIEQAIEQAAATIAAPGGPVVDAAATKVADTLLADSDGVVAKAALARLNSALAANGGGADAVADDARERVAAAVRAGELDSLVRLAERGA